mgnify:CR=1 FL=1
MTDPIASEPLIRVEGLTVEFPVRGSVVRAVDAVSFDVGRGEIVGLVGESASGKSTLGLSLLRMVPSPGRVRADRLEFDGRDLLALSESQMRAIRGSEIALIVQDALATMNPVTTGIPFTAFTARPRGSKQDSRGFADPKRPSVTRPRS